MVAPWRLETKNARTTDTATISDAASFAAKPGAILARKNRGPLAALLLFVQLHRRPMPAWANQVALGAWVGVTILSLPHLRYGFHLHQGVGDAGVRAGQQASVMAALASARPRKRAFIIEDQIEEGATKLFRVLRRMDTTAYPTPSGGEFLLSQLPDTVSMRIASHTSSPLYDESTERKANQLLKAGAIDKAEYVEMIDPPMSDALRAKARKLEKSQAEARKQMIEMKHQEQMARATKKK